MKVGDAVAEIMRREGIEILCGYPVNHLLEYAAKADIRPIIVRQERIGLHMADAISRVTSGKKIGAFCMQHGPGTENAYGGVAQAYSRIGSAAGAAAGLSAPHRSDRSELQRRARDARRLPRAPSRWRSRPNCAMSCAARSATCATAAPGRRIVEIPTDIWNEEIGDLDYTPVGVHKYGPDPADVRKAAAAILAAKRPVIYAGTGVQWAEAWPELRAVRRTAGRAGHHQPWRQEFVPGEPSAVARLGRQRGAQAGAPFRCRTADLIIGIGCSFTETNFGIKFPKGKKFIHATLDPNHLNKDVVSTVGLVGDAKLTLEALIGELKQTIKSNRDTKEVVAEITAVREEWMEQWRPLLNSNEAPISPYRVIWELMAGTDPKNTIITHDAGSPRDQISPFWVSTEPMSYIGWGKTTQLGMGLGLAMGAKLVHPDKTCINFWGDAAIGFTGMDFETAVRERIPILSCLMNNFSMAIELKVMPISTDKYRSTDISGNYADMAKAFGGYGERVTDPNQIKAAIQRGIEQTKAGKPALLEFITAKETRVSKF